MDDLDFLDILTIASSIVWFKTLDENNRNTEHIQRHLNENEEKKNYVDIFNLFFSDAKKSNISIHEIDEKLNWIINKLKEDD